MLNVRSPPIQFASQRIKERAARQMQKPNVVTAAPDRDFITRGQRRGRLAIRAENRLHALRKRFHHNARIQAHDH